ncbi:uncharacterized protein LOC141696231 [Apium graveolens]|uniref:uncharacterized protein LOC141696231 n=1 Tax=Apium graveolens TaxID=4045 RepID=UPI003D7B81D1
MMMLQQMQQQQHQFQQQILQQTVRPEPQAPPVIPVVTFKEFQSMKPLEFEGLADPTKARAWLKDFALVEVEEDQQTDFASYLLNGEANYLSESNKDLEGEGVVNWDRFTDLFLEKYFPRYMKNQMVIKFLKLKQGNLLVTDYEAKFTELARFVPEQVDTDERRAKRFQQRLKPWIRTRVAVFELTTYTAVVQKAIINEEESEASLKKKDHEVSRTSPIKGRGFKPGKM